MARGFPASAASGIRAHRKPEGLHKCALVPRSVKPSSLKADYRRISTRARLRSSPVERSGTFFVPERDLPGQALRLLQGLIWP